MEEGLGGGRRERDRSARERETVCVCDSKMMFQ
jgi:hypothetical protein